MPIFMLPPDSNDMFNLAETLKIGNQQIIDEITKVPVQERVKYLQTLDSRWNTYTLFHIICEYGSSDDIKAVLDLIPEGSRLGLLETKTNDHEHPYNLFENQASNNSELATQKLQVAIASLPEADKAYARLQIAIADFFVRKGRLTPSSFADIKQLDIPQIKPSKEITQLINALSPQQRLQALTAHTSYSLNFFQELHRLYGKNSLDLSKFWVGVLTRLPKESWQLGLVFLKMKGIPVESLSGNVHGIELSDICQKSLIDLIEGLQEPLRKQALLLEIDRRRSVTILQDFVQKGEVDSINRILSWYNLKEQREILNFIPKFGDSTYFYTHSLADEKLNSVLLSLLLPFKNEQGQFELESIVANTFSTNAILRIFLAIQSSGENISEHILQQKLFEAAMLCKQKNTRQHLYNLFMRFIPEEQKMKVLWEKDANNQTLTERLSKKGVSVQHPLLPLYYALENKLKSLETRPNEYYYFGLFKYTGAFSRTEKMTAISKFLNGESLSQKEFQALEQGETSKIISLHLPAEVILDEIVTLDPSKLNVGNSISL